ncbi:hypothetical protein PtA15_5A616 [Puccinia triticina]|uniref:Uncharacterized protein n=1 Tax=Puccinia triticina TaxID=208348 RepID=A0ABY7CKN9_9BASI|nr:uncharacterized protein PtA15_5A616 [Puccinia triticina]WAQ85042.1 hypothetical protein PtA15_5A616 [Puccinia triticina]
MAPVVSTLKRQSHPLFSQSPFDITNILDPIIPPGSSYGQLLFDSTLTFLDSKTGEEINMKTWLQGYGSSASLLLLDKIYLLSGCVIAPNIKSHPVFYYEQDMTLPMGDTKGYQVSLANKASFYGFGVIVSKIKVDDTPSPNSQFKNLSCAQVSFHVRYKVAGSRNLAKTFGLFQIGWEMLLSVYFVKYLVPDKMLEVNVLLVSLSSGYNPLAATDTSTSVKNFGRRKPVQIYFSDHEPVSPMPVAGTSSSVIENHTTGTMSQDPNNGANGIIQSPSSGATDILPKKRKYTKKPKAVESPAPSKDA